MNHKESKHDSFKLLDFPVEENHSPTGVYSLRPRSQCTSLRGSLHIKNTVNLSQFVYCTRGFTMQAGASGWVYTLGQTVGGSLKCNVTFVYTVTPMNVVQCKTSNFGILSSSPFCDINFMTICEALSFMLKDPITPHLCGLTVTCKAELHVKTFTVDLFCDAACTTSTVSHKIRPWIIRIMGQTVLLHFFHKKELDRVLITHDDHTQQITREFVGWIPCRGDIGEAVDRDIGACACSTLRALWTVDERSSYFREYMSSVIEIKLRWCTPNTSDGMYRKVLLDVIRHVGWVLQGYCMDSREDVAQSLLQTLPVSVRRDISLLYPMQSMYRLTDCQGETREQMFVCQMKEEHMRCVHNINKWIRWIDAEEACG